MARLGVIGGSGLYRLEGLEVLDELELHTPFGAPSAPLVLARAEGCELVFLPRHGAGHRIPPHRLNHRANIFAMKLAEVEAIVSISAVGSLKEEVAPGDFVLVDQFIDWTRRPSTFFDDAAVHVSMAEPTCARLRKMLEEACEEAGVRIHARGTYLCIEGPQFSTRAESELYRRWGADVIGMTNAPEAKLAREAGICYATLAMATDYDCWRKAHEAVSTDMVLATLRRNAENAKRVLQRLWTRWEPHPGCACHEALKHAVATAPDALGDQARALLASWGAINA